MSDPVFVTAPTPVLFGTGDGSTSAFPLVLRASLFNGAPSIFRNDWQGNQKLYPTPRTNLLLNSEGYSDTGGVGPGFTVTPNFALAPTGNLRASRVVWAAQANAYWLTNAVALAAGTTVSGFALVKLNSAGTSNIGVFISTPDASQNASVTLSPSLALLASAKTANFSTPAVEVTPIGGGWYLVGLVTTVSVALTLGLVVNSSSAGTGDLLLACSQLAVDTRRTSWISTTTAPVTITDYSIDSAANVLLTEVPATGATLTWQGAFSYVPVPEPISFARSTIISQYANSPTLVQLTESMSGYIDPKADFDAFYKFVWNIKTAQAWGLDILGRIVNVSRQLQIPASVVNFGYKEGLNYQPFGQAPFYVGSPTSNTYLLSDDAFRTLILIKALLNISNSSAPAINQLLKNLFAGRGRCYVTDTGQMQIRFVFEFPLYPYELAILTQSNAVPRPAAVQAQVMQLDLPTTFGFNEAKVFQPFGQGVLFNSSTGLITAN